MEQLKTELRRPWYYSFRYIMPKISLNYIRISKSPSQETINLLSLPDFHSFGGFDSPIC